MKDPDRLYTVDDVDLVEMMRGLEPAKTKNKKKRYMNAIAAFDIETSTFYPYGPRERPQAFMYIWQFQLDEKCTIIGRTWDEAHRLFAKISLICMDYNAKLLCFIHNASFEFQYLSGILHFEQDAVFATDERKVLYFTFGNIEFRCSERLSNMSLRQWLKEMHTDHQKMAGDDLGYHEIKYPWDELTPVQMRYCINDVIGLVEAVKKQIALHKDTIYSLPYTSTGYVRREAKRAMYSFGVDWIRAQQDSLDVYEKLVKLFRGGDTHCNRFYGGCIVEDVWCHDFSSDYPARMIYDRYPVTRFREEAPEGYRLTELLEADRAIIFMAIFENIHLKDPSWPDPYISFDKSFHAGGFFPREVSLDNGRILRASLLSYAMTDLDWKIINETYEWKSMKIIWMYSAKYGKLPQPFRDLIKGYYIDKTALKGVDPERYAQSKAKINACFGMMVQHAIHEPAEYQEDHWLSPSEINYDAQVEYQKAMAKSFLRYAHGVWVTANARYQLFRVMKIAHTQVKGCCVYWDTDSLKTSAPIDFSEYNQEMMQLAMENGTHATDPKGKEHFLGLFEEEEKVKRFRSWGAKKYCCEYDHPTRITKVDPETGEILECNLELTYAGIPKGPGTWVIHDAGGLEAFEPGLSFDTVDKPIAYFNDTDPVDLDVDGHRLTITRNLALVNVPLEMTIAKPYAQLLREVDTERLKGNILNGVFSGDWLTSDEF